MTHGADAGRYGAGAVITGTEECVCKKCDSVASEIGPLMYRHA